MYVFGRERETDPPTDGVLHLRPLRPETEAPASRASLNVVETTLVTAAVCLAPADQQRRWAGRFGSRPLWFTLMGAGAEVLGSTVNLGGTTAAASPLMVALDAVFLLDGLGRLVLAAVRRGPVGSVFGWLIAPLLEPRLPPDDTVVR